MNDHAARVSTVAAQVKHFHAQNTKFRIYHGATNSTRPSPRHREASVDTSRLDQVLQVDTARKIALVEPNCPMDRLLQATLAVGLFPPVVPEFPGITAGGGFAGTAGESSSFKYGFLDAVVNSIEIVLADGRVMAASPSQNEELFYGAAGTLGTLGVLTLLEMQLIDARPYVEVTYHRVDSFQAAVAKTQEVTATPGIDFVDGIMFSKGCGTIITGRLTDDLRGSRAATIRGSTCTRRSKSPAWLPSPTQKKRPSASRSPTTSSATIAAGSGSAPSLFSTFTCPLTASAASSWTRTCTRGSCTMRCMLVA
jgi:FAD/FMN-containing dehydrogenase